MNFEDNPQTPREKLEIKLTALLLGELPAPEAAALLEAIESDQELSAFYERLKRTVDLVRETAATPSEEAATQPVPLKLGDERRQKLLAHFKTIKPREFVRPRSRKMKWWVPVAATAILALIVGAVVLPNFVRARTSSQSNSIINKLRQLDGAKQQWALQNNKSPTETVTYDTIEPYMGRGTRAEHEIPSIAGETYIIGAVEDPPIVEMDAKQAKKVFGKIPTMPVPGNPKRVYLCPLSVEDDMHSESARQEMVKTIDRVAATRYAAFKPPLVVQPPPSAQGVESVPQPIPGSVPPAAVFARAPTTVVLPSSSSATEGDLALNDSFSRAVAPANLPANNTISGEVNAEKVPIRYAFPSSFDTVGFNSTATTMGTTATEQPAEQAAEAKLFAGKDKVPLVGDVPIVGSLFQASSTKPAAGDRWDLTTENGNNFDSAGNVITTPQSADTFAFEPSGGGGFGGGGGGGGFFARFPGQSTQWSEVERLITSSSSRSSQNSPLQTRAQITASSSVGPGGGAKYDNNGGTAVSSGTFALNERNQNSAETGSANQAELHGSNVPKISLTGITTITGKKKNMMKVPASEAVDETARTQAVAMAPIALPSAAPAGQAGQATISVDPGTHELIVMADAKTPNQIAQQVQKLSAAPENVDRLKTAAGNQQSDVAPPKSVASAPIPQPEVQTRDNAFSTFSLNVSDVSFKLAAASLEKGVMPDPAGIRSEEFINAFDYRDPEPAAGAPITFASERARYPFAHNRDLLRFSITTAAQGRQAGRPLNIVLLLDNSGSMERADRVRIIHEALRVLASQLQPQDKLSVVVFARTARLWVDGLSGSQAGEIVDGLSSLTPQGGTNLEDAMNLAYQTALRHYMANGNNRIELLTDGAANLGNVDPEALKRKVEAHRKQGIALDCFGIGWEGYNDDLLEVLSRNGDGRYGFINTPEEAAAGFAGQLAGALRVAASDVKVQVEFNPGRVTGYHQIGYARHQLTKEQFRDNTVNAATIGAAESGNALYVIESNPVGEGPIGTVRVRYRVPGTTDYREQEWTVPYTGKAVSLENASAAMRLAGTAGAFSEWLAASPYAAEVTPDQLLNCLSRVPETYGADARPKKLEWMIRQAKSITGK
jgi:Mg-chelatase subunit ChlD/negative regulator of sigma E activity